MVQSRWIRLSLVPVTLAITLIASVASAEESARELFERGTDAYHIADYDGAIAAWERAYELDPRPLLQYNLSQAYERAGRLEDAVGALETYLQIAPADDAARATATARLATMRERLSRTGVIVRSNVDGAAVIIDGEERARTPRPDPIPLAPGTHSLVVRAEGYEPHRAEIAVTGGRVVEVDATLQAIGGTSEHPSRVGAWALVGGGGAVLVTGAILGGLALGKAHDAQFRDDDTAESARTFARTGDVLMGVGAAATVGGILWAVLAGRHDDAGDGQARLRLAPSVGFGELGLSATGRF
jgi:tetratricopeptide (TPR) repeat protein